MVYIEQNQLRRYHVRPEPFLSTHAHFYDGPSQREAPAPEFRPQTVPHKKSTYAKLYNGSPFHQQKLMDSSKGPAAAGTTLTLFPEPLMHTRTIPSSTYRGNGTFTVEYPHSNLTYRSLKLVPYAQLSWKSEYGDKFHKKAPYKGYSILSSRR